MPALGTLQSNPNDQIPYDFFSGNPNYNMFSRTQTTVGYELEHHFDDVWAARQITRFMHNESEFKAYSVLPNANAWAAVARCGGIANLCLGRQSTHYIEQFNALAVDNQREADFDTGPIEQPYHDAVERCHHRCGNQRPRLYLASRTALPVRQRHRALCQLCHVIRPDSATGFGGVPFDPTTSQQYEVVIKYQPPGFDGVFTAAFYDLTQQNVPTTDLAHTVTNMTVTGCSSTTCQTQTGEVRSRGVELGTKFALTDSLNVSAAYT